MFNSSKKAKVVKKTEIGMRNENLSEKLHLFTKREQKKRSV